MGALHKRLVPVSPELSHRHGFERRLRCCNLDPREGCGRSVKPSLVLAGAASYDVLPRTTPTALAMNSSELIALSLEVTSVR